MKIICAYNINVDALNNINGEQISKISRTVRVEKKERIENLNDLISALMVCMRDGSGTELLINDEKTAETIGAFFDWHYRLGGNAGIMSNVLASLGAVAVLNAPALSRRIADMLNPHVKIPVSGRLVEPMSALSNKEMKHFVLQFSQGDEIQSSKERIVAAKDNRLIASFDPVNAHLFTNPDFDSYCHENINHFSGAVVSGFHLAPGNGYSEIFDTKIEQIISWKKANPDLIIHAEMGNFQKPGMIEYLMENLPVRSIGLNEDELDSVAGKVSNWAEAEEEVVKLRDRLDISRIAVHTRYYILSAVRDFLPPQTEVESLMFGAKAAATVSATGSIGGHPPNEIAKPSQKILSQFVREGAIACGNGAYKLDGEVAICMAPSFSIPHPKITVGLGDTATAAIFFHELKAFSKKNL